MAAQETAILSLSKDGALFSSILVPGSTGMGNCFFADLPWPLELLSVV